jgi:3-hydroxyanthranilate 3,4-dioxygenase
LEGSIKVVIQEDGERKEMELHPGDMYLHPAKIPHSPVRSEGSIGLVIERKRAGLGFTDGLLWHCENCNHKLHEVYFELHNIEKDFLSHFEHFYSSERLRTCTQCGTVMDTDSRFLSKK